MNRKFACLCLFSSLLLAAVSAQAQGTRDHTRPAEDSARARYRIGNNRKGMVVSDTQASDLTLTLNQVSVRPIQTWVRTAARIDKTGKVLTAYVQSPEAGYVKVG